MKNCKECGAEMSEEFKEDICFVCINKKRYSDPHSKNIQVCQVCGKKKICPYELYTSWVGADPYFALDPSSALMCQECAHKIQEKVKKLLNDD